MIEVGLKRYEQEIINPYMENTAGSCWLKQCQLPKPCITLLESKGKTFLPGNTFSIMSIACISCLQLNTGNTIPALQI